MTLLRAAAVAAAAALCSTMHAPRQLLDLRTRACTHALSLHTCN